MRSTHSQQAATTGTQLTRFFDFLGDEALSRVRLQVASRMMETRADAAQERQQAHPERGWSLLMAYTRRATGLLDALATTGLPLNLSSVYGKAGDLDLRNHVTTASFVNCLPVWPQWMTQMFEELHDPSSRNTAGDVTRELTYRFRVNGPVPEMPSLSAYENRLQRIEAYRLRLTATGQDEPPQRVARSLAELVFLWAVIPTSPETPVSREDALRSAEQLVRSLEQGGRPALVQALAELRQRVPMVDEITKALTSLMRTKGTVLTRSALGRRWTYHINVLREIVDLGRAAEKVDRHLRCSTSPSQEQIDFLQNIRVTSESFSRALFSIQVSVRLSEYSMQLAGERDDRALAPAPEASCADCLAAISRQSEVAVANLDTRRPHGRGMAGARGAWKSSTAPGTFAGCQGWRPIRRASRCSPRRGQRWPLLCTSHCCGYSSVLRQTRSLGCQ